MARFGMGSMGKVILAPSFPTSVSVLGGPANATSQALVRGTATSATGGQAAVRKEQAPPPPPAIDDRWKIVAASAGLVLALGLALSWWRRK